MKGNISMSVIVGLIIGIPITIALFFLLAQFLGVFGPLENDDKFIPIEGYIWPLSTLDRQVDSCFGGPSCVKFENDKCISYEDNNNHMDIKANEDDVVVAIVNGRTIVDEDNNIIILITEKVKIKYYHVEPSQNIDGNNVIEGAILGKVSKFDENLPEEHFKLEIEDNGLVNPLCYLEHSYKFKQGLKCESLAKVC